MKKSENNKSPMAQRGMRRSERIIHFATKVTPEFDNIIRKESQERGLYIAEILEEYQQAHLEKKEKEKPFKTKK